MKLKQKDIQFRTLVRMTCRHLSRTITTQEGFSDFKVAVTLLPASLDGCHILLSSDDRNAISRAKSFDHIFVVLNYYWDFVQYELLECVVREYGNFHLKKEMKGYVEAMVELQAQIGITGAQMVSTMSIQNVVVSSVHVAGEQWKRS